MSEQPSNQAVPPANASTSSSSPRQVLARRLMRPLRRVPLRVRMVLSFLLLTLVCTLLLTRFGGRLPVEEYREGDVVTATIVSPADIISVDPPATVTLRRHQIVAHEGEIVTRRTLAQIAALRHYEQDERRPHHFAGLFIIVGALFYGAWKYTEHRSETATLALSKHRAFALLGLSVVVQTVLMRFGFTFAEGIAGQSSHAPLNDPTAWSFAIPFAAASLLVALLVDAQLALRTGLIIALFAGLIAPNGILMSLYAMVSSSAAIYSISRYRERQSVTLAGLTVGAVNALMAVAVILSAQQPLTLNSVLLVAACGVAGGLLTTIFTAGGLPINEAAFDILTDVKLLELSNANIPLLGQLALRAPGTNQHSHAVGQIAEEAARAVGANPLLARIGALYHDIGKLAQPEMFVENQMGVNPHDQLTPAESACVIINHVIYGARLADELGLPKQIADFIPQHHGTRTLHYFLSKSCKLSPDAQIDDKDFRYPGPKPQFKESAIVMLSDSCEAGVRSLANPNGENVRQIIYKIFDAVLSDNQLDECDLNLRELTLIRESIITSLTAIYHGRIDYPGFNPLPLTSVLPTMRHEQTRNGAANGSSPAPTTIAVEPAQVPISSGGEVEEEAVAGASQNK